MNIPFYNSSKFMDLLYYGNCIVQGFPNCALWIPLDPQPVLMESVDTFM